LTKDIPFVICPLSLADTHKIFNENPVNGWEIQRTPPQTKTETERHSTDD
jgi:hypothetical protein